MNLKIGAAAVALLLLAGCAPTPEPQPSSEAISSATASATPTSTPTLTPTPSPTPTVAPVPLDPADPSTWVIGFDSVGPLVPGMTPDAALAAAVGYESSSYEGCRVVFADREGYPSLALTYWPDDVINRIIVRSKEATAATLATSPKTEAGIGVGSTASEFGAAYPDAQVLIDHGESFRVFAVGNNAGRYLVLALTDNIVGSIDVTSEPTFAYELC
jgi:hypothetical protein